jgi:hypothetical protein
MSETVKDEVDQDAVEALTDEIIGKIKEPDGDGLDALEVLEACVEVSGFVMGALLCSCCRAKRFKEVKAQLRESIAENAKIAEQYRTARMHQH